MKEVFTEEWARPKDYLLLKNIGVLSMSILGGTVIDRCISRSAVDVEDMKAYVEQAKGRFDWRKDAAGERAITGMSGNRAALIIAGEMANELADPDASNAIKDLQAKLVASAKEPLNQISSGSVGKPSGRARSVRLLLALCHRRATVSTQTTGFSRTQPNAGAVSIRYRKPL